MAATDPASQCFTAEDVDAQPSVDRIAADRVAWRHQAQKVRALALRLFLEESRDSTAWVDSEPSPSSAANAAPTDKLTAEYLAESEKLFELTRRLAHGPNH